MISRIYGTGPSSVFRGLAPPMVSVLTHVRIRPKNPSHSQRLKIPKENGRHSLKGQATGRGGWAGQDEPFIAKFCK